MPTPAEAAAGPVYFGVHGTGVVRLDGGRFERVLDIDYTIHDIDVGADGTVWVAAIDGVYRIRGADSGAVGDGRSPGAMDRVAAGRDGEAWSVGSGGIAHYDGAGWTVEPREVLGAALIEDVAVDADGRPWVLSRRAVFARDGGAWSTIDIGAGDPERTFLHAIEVGADGALYVGGNMGVRVRRDGVWTEHALRAGYRGVDRLAIGADGEVRGLAGLETLYVFSGGTTREVSADSAGFVASAVKDLAVDAAGRTWLGTDYGVVVLDARGGLLAQWVPGSVPEIPGTVVAVAVAGAGPALPEVSGQALGTVRGRIVSQGEGVPDAVVELCETPAVMFKVSPCDGAVFRRRVRTGADGRFEVPGIPIGTYGFAIRATKTATWQLTLAALCCSKMRPDQAYDIGSLSIDQ